MKKGMRLFGKLCRIICVIVLFLGIGTMKVHAESNDAVTLPVTVQYDISQEKFVFRYALENDGYLAYYAGSSLKCDAAFQQAVFTGNDSIAIEVDVTQNSRYIYVWVVDEAGNRIADVISEFRGGLYEGGANLYEQFRNPVPNEQYVEFVNGDSLSDYDFSKWAFCWSQGSICCEVPKEIEDRGVLFIEMILSRDGEFVKKASISCYEGSKSYYFGDVINEYGTYEVSICLVGEGVRSHYQYGIAKFEYKEEQQKVDSVSDLHWNENNLVFGVPEIPKFNNDRIWGYKIQFEKIDKDGSYSYTSNRIIKNMELLNYLDRNTQTVSVDCSEAFSENYLTRVSVTALSSDLDLYAHSNSVPAPICDAGDEILLLPFSAKYDIGEAAFCLDIALKEGTEGYLAYYVGSLSSSSSAYEKATFTGEKSATILIPYNPSSFIYTYFWLADENGNKLKDVWLSHGNEILYGKSDLNIVLNDGISQVCKDYEYVRSLEYTNGDGLEDVNLSPNVANTGRYTIPVPQGRNVESLVYFVYYEGVYKGRSNIEVPADATEVLLDCADDIVQPGHYDIVYSLEGTGVKSKSYAISFDYVPKQNKVGKASEVLWNKSAPGTVSFTYGQNENVAGYLVTVEKRKSGTNFSQFCNTFVTKNSNWYDSSTDRVFWGLTDETRQENVWFRVWVQAISDDLDKYAHGERLYSGLFTYSSDIAETITIEDVFEDLCVETMADIRSSTLKKLYADGSVQIRQKSRELLSEELSKLDVSEYVTLMQRADYQKVIEEIENLKYVYFYLSYDSAMEAIVDVDKIQIRGAKLNVADGIKTIEIRGSGKTKLDGISSLSDMEGILQLTATGIDNSEGGLKVPVILELPYPEDLETEKLVIVNLKADNTVENIYYAYDMIINREKQTLQVALNHFEKVILAFGNNVPTPTPAPTATPTPAPTATPTVAPTATPTATPTAAPTATPTAAPTATPTAAPTATPTAAPTAAPTAVPTPAPIAEGSLAMGSDGNWYYYVNGVVDTSYTGLVPLGEAWWMVVNGKIDFTYTSAVFFGDEWWFVRNGEVEFSYNGLVFVNDNWWYVVNGRIDLAYNGLAYVNDAWWYVTQGKIDFTYTGLTFYNDDWWYIENGSVNFNYNGLAFINDNWWYVVTGRIDFSYNVLMYFNDNWWYVETGKINFAYNGLAFVNDNWWYVQHGMIDFSYTGLAFYNNDWWYVESARVNFDYNGTALGPDGNTYNVVNGKVVF